MVATDSRSVVAEAADEVELRSHGLAPTRDIPPSVNRVNDPGRVAQNTQAVRRTRLLFHVKHVMCR